MDTFFAMDSYYNGDDTESKAPVDPFTLKFDSTEQEVYAVQPSTSPELKPVQSDGAPSNASSSPAETQQAWQAKRPRKRHDEIHRPFRCGWDGCEKAYGRLNHLNTHVAIHRHGPRRTGMDFPSASRKKTMRMILPDLKPDYQLLPNDSSSSDTSPEPTPSATEEPFIFNAAPEWYPLFPQSQDATGEQIPFDRYSYLAVQKSRVEHGRNEALNRVKNLELERNNLAEELSRLDRQLDHERSTFTREQQTLDATMGELSQWRYPQTTEVPWL